MIKALRFGPVQRPVDVIPEKFQRDVPIQNATKGWGFMTVQSQTGEIETKENETLKFPCQSRNKQVYRMCNTGVTAACYSLPLSFFEIAKLLIFHAVWLILTLHIVRQTEPSEQLLM